MSRLPTPRITYPWILGLALGGLIATSATPRQVGTSLVETRSAFLIVAFACWGVYAVTRGVRWNLLLQDSAPTIRTLLSASLASIGSAVDAVRPGGEGAVTRAVLLSQRTGASLHGVTQSLRRERVLDVAALATSATLGLLGVAYDGHLDGSSGLQHAARLLWPLPVAVVLGFLLAGGLASPGGPAMLGRVGRFTDEARHLAKDMDRLPGLVLLTVAATGAQVCAFAALIAAVAPHWPAAFIVVVPLLLLATRFTPTPLQLGWFEAAFLVALAPLGIGWHAVLIVAVTVHLFTLAAHAVAAAAGYVGLRMGGAPLHAVASGATLRP